MATMTRRYELQKTNESGSFSVCYTFEPIGDGSTVRVSKQMFDSLMGAWWSPDTTEPRIIPVNEARKIYRECKANGLH